MNASAPCTEAYFGDAMKVSSLSLASLKLGTWRWEAFVYARTPGKKPALVYRRRCLNEAHARKVAAETAKRFNDYLARTGERWEARRKAPTRARKARTARQAG